MDVKTCQEMIQGKAAPLVSTFRLSYYTLLNLMSRAEGHFNVEHVIRNSFHQFQHNKVKIAPWICLYFYWCVIRSEISLIGHGLLVSILLSFCLSWMSSVLGAFQDLEVLCGVKFIIIGICPRSLLFMKLKSFLYPFFLLPLFVFHTVLHVHSSSYFFRRSSDLHFYGLCELQALPSVEEQIRKLEEETSSIDAAGEVRWYSYGLYKKPCTFVGDFNLPWQMSYHGYSDSIVCMQASLGEYHALRLKLAELEKKMMVEVLRPERVLIFLQPGRLVCFSLCVENKPC